MTGFQTKIQNALDECRMLILGGQVLISFAAEAVLEPGFRELSGAGQRLCVGGMACLVLAVGVFMTPAAYHRIACGGEDRADLHVATGRLAAIGLVPFAAGLATAVSIVGERVANPRFGAALGSALLALAVAAWYAFPVLMRTRPREFTMPERAQTPLPEKIRHVLTEARMVLPGAQALLGFGTISVLMDRFKELPVHLKMVHLVGLAAIAVAVVLLMTPAAFHRIAESGEQSERLHRLASALLLSAMAFLAIGMAAAVWLVVEVGTCAPRAAQFSAAGVLAVFLLMWFAWPASCRSGRLPGTSSRA